MEPLYKQVRVPPTFLNALLQWLKPYGLTKAVGLKTQCTRQQASSDGSSCGPISAENGIAWLTQSDKGIQTQLKVRYPLGANALGTAHLNRLNSPAFAKEQADNRFYVDPTLDLTSIPINDMAMILQKYLATQKTDVVTNFRDIAQRFLNSGSSEHAFLNNANLKSWFIQHQKGLTKKWMDAFFINTDAILKWRPKAIDHLVAILKRFDVIHTLPQSTKNNERLTEYMLTVQQIDNEISKLERVSQNRTLSNQEKIQLARFYICKNHIRLFRKKNNAVDKRDTLSWDYDREVLIQIRTILIHARHNWKLETDEQRRGSLYNIVQATLLLRPSFTLLYNTNYLSQGQYSDAINLWRNLQFLNQCKLAPPDYTVLQIFPIKSDQINRLLKELFPLIEDLFSQEIDIGIPLLKAYNIVQADNTMALHKLLKESQYDKNYRHKYRNPYSLHYLHAFTIYRREKFRIQKMQDAIESALKFNINRFNESYQMALMRQFQIIGESATGKNFSKKTKRLIDSVNWQLLVRLRNKLSHNEWDIHPNILMRRLRSFQKIKNCLCLNNWLMKQLADGNINIEQLKIIRHLYKQGFKTDLRQLGDILENLKEHHQATDVTDKKLLQHYSSAWYMRDKTKQSFRHFISRLLEQNLITAQQAKTILAGLKGDIRERNIPIDEIKPLLINNTTNNLNRRNKPDLWSEFNRLCKAYNNEKVYHRNLVNPDKKHQRAIQKRLSKYQVHIRFFNRLLSYTNITYKADLKDHKASFEPRQLIQLIKNEITAIKQALQPLLGSEALHLEFPENVTVIPYAWIVDTIGRIPYADIKEAIRHIKTYCSFNRKPVHLKLEGLNYNLKCGEMDLLKVNTLFQDIQSLLKSVKLFGKKCCFYVSLIIYPEVVEACFYRMARIQKYIVVLKLSQVIDVDQLLNFEEIKALRNFIHHGSDLFDTMNVNALEFMARYAALFINKLLPAINEIHRKMSGQFHPKQSHEFQGGAETKQDLLPISNMVETEEKRDNSSKNNNELKFNSKKTFL